MESIIFQYSVIELKEYKENLNLGHADKCSDIFTEQCHDKPVFVVTYEFLSTLINT